VVSVEKLSAPLDGLVTEGDRRVIRCDSVAFPPGGCAYLHTHRGPGIRCLLRGTMRIDSAGRSTLYRPGEAWFEPGPEPVFAQADAHVPTRFIRVMILPPDLLGQRSIAYVNPDDRDRPKSQAYRVYVDEPIAV
jgi:quercetin dioxygenase-like cupin family protein